SLFAKCRISPTERKSFSASCGDILGSTAGLVVVAGVECVVAGDSLAAFCFYSWADTLSATSRKNRINAKIDAKGGLWVFNFTIGYEFILSPWELISGPLPITHWVT